MLLTRSRVTIWSADRYAKVCSGLTGYILNGNLCYVMTDENTPLQKGLPGLRAIREALGLSQKEVAEKVHCTPDFIRFIETGRSDCRQDLHRQLAQALCCKVVELFEAPAPERLAEIKDAFEIRKGLEAAARQAQRQAEQEKGVA